MASKNTKEELTTFPPNVPQELIDKYRWVVRQNKDKGGYQRKLARHLDVNMLYLNNLLKHGTEPTSRTKKGREAREKLFLKNDDTLNNKEEVIEALEQLVTSLQKTIRRLRG